MRSLLNKGLGMSIKERLVFFSNSIVILFCVQKRGFLLVHLPCNFRTKNELRRYLELNLKLSQLSSTLFTRVFFNPAQKYEY